MRRVILAVRADVRMGNAASASRYAQLSRSQQQAFSTKSGKQLLKDAQRAKNIAEEAQIKQRAADSSGGRFY